MIAWKSRGPRLLPSRNSPTGEPRGFLVDFSPSNSVPALILRLTDFGSSKTPSHKRSRVSSVRRLRGAPSVTPATGSFSTGRIPLPSPSSALTLISRESKGTSLGLLKKVSRLTSGSMGLPKTSRAATQTQRRKRLSTS